MHSPSPSILSARQPENIVRVAQLLRQGGIVVVPTDTVYGLAASIYQAEAVERLFVAKRRAAEARVPVLLATAADLPLLAERVPRVAWLLIDRFWPGPLTLVLPAGKSAPPEITRGGGTVAVRVPAARSCLKILEVLGEPLVGTSANVSGSPPARTALEAVEQLGADVDAVVEDDAAIRAGVSSTVVEIVDKQLIIHRVGAVSADHIRETAGMAVHVRRRLTTDTDRR